MFAAGHRDVSPVKDGEAFALAVKLVAVLPGLEQGQAGELVTVAQQLCPYSRATKGNIEVEVVAKTA